MEKAFGAHPGAMTAQAKHAHQSPMAFAHSHEHDSGITGKRARLAEIGARLSGHHRGHALARHMAKAGS